MIDFPIVDTHVHLLDHDKLNYPWVDDLPLLGRSFVLEDFDAARGPVDVEKIVFVQVQVEESQFVREIEWVASLAERDSRVAGAVAWAPLSNGESVRCELEQLVQLPILRGIRQVIENESDLDFCIRPDFVRGVQSLAQFDKSFDICVNHLQLNNTIKLVEQCPDVRFILDHIGKPDIKQQLFDPWCDELKTLASLPNVTCKISGMATEADHDNWTRDDLVPYIDHVIECFGFDRVMYGGDWPVSTMATDYPRWVQTLHWVVSGASQAEQRKLFRDNAIEVYRL